MRATLRAIISNFRLVFFVLAISALMQVASGQLAAQTNQADIVFVVDTSVSMVEEVSVFELSINSFVGALQGNGVDPRIIVIGSPLCIQQPVGTGSCPDDDEQLPLYRHVIQEVNSSDPLLQFLSTFDQWSGQLRNGAYKTIVVLTDGDSSLSIADFGTQLDQSFAGYRFHGMINTNCADFGLAYIALAALTDGTTHDLCLGTQVISAGLNEIAQIIVDDLGAEPPQPPVVTCADAANAAINAGQTYIKAARLVRRLCKTDGLDCQDALGQSVDTFATLTEADQSLQQVCP